MLQYLVSHFKEDSSKSWDSASEKLQDFWDYISSDSPSRDVNFRIRWWNEVHKNNPNAASSEAARRYYSAKYFLQNGADRAFSEPKLILDENSLTLAFLYQIIFGFAIVMID